MTTRPLIVAALVAGLSSTAHAQQAPIAAPATPPAGESASVDVDRLPLDLARLERQLRQTSERENWDGFRLRYSVEVFGKAPRLQFFAPEDVLPSGPIPYGAPTHKEMIEVMTPKEFRSPPMDFANLMRWLQEKMK